MSVSPLAMVVLTDAGFRAIDRDPPGTVTDADTAPPAASAETVAQEAAAVADALDAAPHPCRSRFW